VRDCVSRSHDVTRVGILGRCNVAVSLSRPLFFPALPSFLGLASFQRETRFHHASGKTPFLVIPAGFTQPAFRGADGRPRFSGNSLYSWSHAGESVSPKMIMIVLVPLLC
jgi:hypothetical protein